MVGNQASFENSRWVSQVVQLSQLKQGTQKLDVFSERNRSLTVPGVSKKACAEQNNVDYSRDPGKEGVSIVPRVCMQQHQRAGLAPHSGIP